MSSSRRTSRSRAAGHCAAWILLVLGAFSGARALAADLRVLCPSALREPVLEIARAFARASGERVEFVFASAGAVHKRLATGERADLAIGTREGIDALVGLGPGLAGSQTVIARSALALAVRAGKLPPDVSVRDALIRALSSAGSIAAPDPRSGVPGGAQVAELLDALKLTEALRSRIRWVLDPREAAKRVASGEVEVALAAMNDVVGAAGVEVAGPIVEPMTRAITYAAVIARSAANPERARAFIDHLRLPEAASVFRRAGYIPAQ